MDMAVTGRRRRYCTGKPPLPYRSPPIARRAAGPLVVARRVLLAGICLVLAACNSGSGDDSGPDPVPNTPPVANAGTDQNVAELSTVALNGSGTDANNDTLTFAWTQVSGTTVTLINADTAQASFEAPAAAGGQEVLTFRLTVTDTSGATGSDEVRITVLEPGSVVTVSGVARYEFVPPNSGCVGLNYPATELRPIRRATVQLIDAASGAVHGTTTTNDHGNYAITVDPGINVRLRVRAELKRNGAPSWDVDVRDNTSNTASALPSRPLYVLDTGAFSSGAVEQTRDVTATTGWNGTSYGATRAAAPFAVLDAIYSAMQLVLSVDATASFPPLDAFWSVNNSPAQGEGTFDDNIESGDIGTSFYSSGLDSLFLLGQADSDTEEFDDHVIVHEWGHYFEDVFSRSDSIGGAHGTGDRLDMRLAFGEGWATALSGIALDNPDYCDTQGTRQANGFRIGIENNSIGPDGWFSEFSILQIIYDLWDMDIDGADTGSIGFAPIYETMTNVQISTPAHTSIFSFADALKTLSPAGAPLVDALLAEQDISGTGIYGDGETNDSISGNPDDVLPVYTEITPNGTTINICSNRQFDSDFNGNKLSEYRFLRMTITNPSRYEFSILTDDATVAKLPPDDLSDERDQSDPDIRFYLNGAIQNRVVDGAPQGLSGEANSEYFVTPNVLAAGDYVMDLVEFRHTDEDSDAGFPSRSCFDVTINAAP